MRTLPPHTAELPVTRNMPFSSKSVPSKDQPRNMTGIYLGLEGNVKPPSIRTVGISPLARGRRISNRIRTPTEQRRYKLVEQLRIKEESRGFIGQPVKRKQAVISPEDSHSSLSPRSQVAKKWGPAKHANRNDFNDLIRTNPRNFTVVVNNGVTRSENLSGLSSYEDYINDSGVYAEALADEVTKISTRDADDSALEECFKHVCKGKVESLQTLLPFRRAQFRSQTPFASTGFTVRSYRNPNRAEIMANFNQSERPKTVPSQPSRPLVPSPYFFRYYSNPYNKFSLSAKSTRNGTTSAKFEHQFQSLNGTSKVMAAHGAGALSRSIKSRAAWSESDFKLHGKLHGTPRDNKDEDSVQETGKPVQISMKVGDDGKMTDIDHKKEDIHFGVEDEHGREGEVEIDAAEEEHEEVIPFRGKVRKASITDKVEKSRMSQAYIDTIKEDAEHRKKQLEKMLDEHAEIVQEIGRSSSRDNLSENRDH